MLMGESELMMFSFPGLSLRIAITAVTVYRSS